MVVRAEEKGSLKKASWPEGSLEDWEKLLS